MRHNRWQRFVRQWLRDHGYMNENAYPTDKRTQFIVMVAMFLAHPRRAYDHYAARWLMLPGDVFENFQEARLYVVTRVLPEGCIAVPVDASVWKVARIPADAVGYPVRCLHKPQNMWGVPCTQSWLPVRGDMAVQARKQVMYA